MDSVSDGKLLWINVFSVVLGKFSGLGRAVELS